MHVRHCLPYVAFCLPTILPPVLPDFPRILSSRLGTQLPSEAGRQQILKKFRVARVYVGR